MMLSVPSVTMNGGISEPRDQGSVEETEGRADKKAEREGDDGRHAVEHGETPHDHRGNHHDDADRKVDASGQDDQRLSDAENAGDHHLRQHGREIARGGESRRIDGDAEQEAEH